MKNQLLSCLVVAMGMAFSGTSQAHEDHQELCYPLEHGENGLGSTHSFHLPHFHSSGRWVANYAVTNIGDKPVNVKYRFKLGNGSAYHPKNADFYESFNSGNNPLLTDTGGAILLPGQTGRIRMDDDTLNSIFTGTIHWQADSCITHSLVASARSSYWSGSYSGNTTIFLNGGNPF